MNEAVGDRSLGEVAQREHRAGGLAERQGRVEVGQIADAEAACNGMRACDVDLRAGTDGEAVVGQDAVVGAHDGVRTRRAAR